VAGDVVARAGAQQSHWVSDDDKTAKYIIDMEPQAVSADNGYWNGKHVEDARVQGIDLYVATGKQKHGQPSKAWDEEARESSAEASCWSK
jgi:hypothetical protein